MVRAPVRGGRRLLVGPVVVLVLLAFLDALFHPAQTRHRADQLVELLGHIQQIAQVRRHRGQCVQHGQDVTVQLADDRRQHVDQRDDGVDLLRAGGRGQPGDRRLQRLQDRLVGGQDRLHPGGERRRVLDHVGGTPDQDRGVATDIVHTGLDLVHPIDRRVDPHRDRLDLSDQHLNPPDQRLHVGDHGHQAGHQADRDLGRLERLGGHPEHVARSRDAHVGSVRGGRRTGAPTTPTTVRTGPAVTA